MTMLRLHLETGRLLRKTWTFKEVFEISYLEEKQNVGRAGKTTGKKGSPEEAWHWNEWSLKWSHRKGLGSLCSSSKVGCSEQKLFHLVQWTWNTAGFWLVFWFFPVWGGRKGGINPLSSQSAHNLVPSRGLN